MVKTQLSWDLGTAYDLFVSLWVLHAPDDFGVRRSWAAGVRARLPVEERELLEQTYHLVHVPLHWIYALPKPKDANSVLWTLSQIPPAERLAALTVAPDWPTAGMVSVLKEVAARGSWGERDQEALLAACRQSLECDAEMLLPGGKLGGLLDWWARAEDFGQGYLAALRAYQEAFFAEEERRIAPALRAALDEAQQVAGRLELLDLLEELSHGLRFEEPPAAPELILAPSYWGSPLMFFGQVKTGVEIRLFGARPPDASLVPGESVPDALLQALKALSDPTRLRILRYLGDEPLTQAELARRLRLRAPTVTHHLQALRLAGLIQLKIGRLVMDDGKETRRYATRLEAIRAVFDSLQAFLQK